MSEAKIRRKSKPYTATVHATTASATTIHVGDTAGGWVQLGTHSTEMTALVVYVSASADGPFTILRSGGTPALMTCSGATAGAEPLPDAAFASEYIKLAASNTAGNSVTCTVMVKG
jgi:hypothetical protein